MINGIKPSMTKSLGAANGRSAGSSSGAQPAAAVSRSFAEQLVGADRPERGEKPGREDRATRTTREGLRSDESDARPGQPSAAKQEPKAATKLAKLERPQAESRVESPRRKLKISSADGADLREAAVETPPQPAAIPGVQPAPAMRVSEPIEQPVSENESDGLDEVSSREVNGEKPEPGLKAPAGALTMMAPQLAETSHALESDPSAMPNVAPNAMSGPIADALEEVKQEQVQVRQTALQNFMTNMQSEFGISPDKIVQAFSKMDEKTLMAPPEESTKDFLSNLELPKDKQGRASELYKQMVRSTGDAALNEKLIGLEQQGGVNVDVLSPRDQALMQLNTAIDQLNDSFAMRPPTKGVVAQSPLDNQIKAQMAADQMSAKLMQLQGMDGPQDPYAKKNENDSAAGGLAGMISMKAAGGSAGTAAAGSGSAMSTGADGIAGALGSGGQMSALTADGFGSSMSNDTAFGGGANGAQTPAMDAPTVSTTNASNSPASFASAMKASAATSETKSTRKADVKTAGAAGGETALNEPSALSNQAAAPVQLKAPGAGPAGMILERPTASAQDEQDNVKELIHQAQLAVKKGGGEIKMDLKPEGIGQVHLKVSVDGGQVSVQMLTQNDEAKRVLEKGLHELKSSLAAHQLKVENLKVDVGTDIQKHMDKGADDQARQQTREFAQDVMSNLRDERQAMQQGFMENRGWRQYPQGRSRDGVQPEAATAVAATAKRGEAAKRSNSSRLDLVA